MLSICVPTYNRSGTVGEAVASAISQIGERDVEILVVDNASSDRTEDVIARLDHPAVRYLRFEKLVSLFGNHNRCVEHARGRWIMFLHSDDLVPSGYLDHIDEWISENPDVDLLTDVSPLLDDNLLGHATTLPDVQHRSARTIASTLIAGGGPPSGSVYRLGCFAQSGTFDENNICGDNLLLIRWVLDGRRVLHFRHHPAVWIVKDISTSSSLKHLRNHWQDAKENFDVALRGPLSDLVMREIKDIFELLPSGLKTIFLYHCVTHGYRSLAMRLLLRVPGGKRCWLERRMYTVVLPALISPPLYHAVRWRVVWLRRAWIG